MPRPLVSRQRRIVLVGLANGMTAKEMAKALSVTESTVKTHINRLFRVLGVRNAAQAVGMGFKLRMIDPRQVVLDGECPGTEMWPNHCKCSCQGCKFNCSAHFVKGPDDAQRR